MGWRYFLLGHRAPHLLHLVGMLDGIDLLHMCRLDLLEPEGNGFCRHGELPFEN